MRCPSIFSSIAIELNVPHDEFSSITIELTFVLLERGFKKAGSDSWNKDFLNPITSVYICILRLGGVTIGESPRVCSKYTFY